MYHALDVKKVFKSLDSSQKGLSESQAKEKLKEHGPNELVRKEHFSVAKRLLAQFTNLMVVVLIIAGVAAFALGERIDASVILGIVFLNAIIGFFQEFKAERSLEALRGMVEPMALVIRDGKEQKVRAKTLVPGDLIILEEGSKIPADCRLVEAAAFQTQEATLTGESIPVSKQVAALPEETDARSNMAFMGTIVVKGRAKALVTSTGMETEFGKIADMTQVVKEEPSPLQKELSHVGKFIGQATLGICLFVFMWGVLSGYDQFMMFLFAVSLAVAAVPEGLPATVTIALAMGVQRMAGKKSIVRRLASVETLGSTTVICSDKTGTLTKNEMTVRELYANDKMVEVTGAGYAPKGDFYSGEQLIALKDLDEFHHLLCIASLCNDAALVHTPKSTAWDVLGDPTEGALIVAGKKMKLDLDVLREQYPRVKEIPFDSVRKRMTTIHTSDGSKVAFMKGAPDEVIKRCTKISIHGKIHKLTKERKAELLKKNEEMASRALRVLSFAYRELPKNPKGDVEKNLTFLGLMGMLDPPREGVKEAVATCKQAGIKVIIITGDFGVTAKAVAEDVGIKADMVVDGEELDRMNKADLKRVLNHDVIFARTTPRHKLMIVSTLQHMGHIVAVTGVGVNDAPALKKAEIGVAMGITGTDVSREASDMILTDDSFSTIVSAIKEGRTIYDDIQKFFRYIFSSNIGELMTIFFGMLLGLPLPLLATQILWVDLGTDVLPALALGIDPSEKDVMRRRPRNPKERMITAHKFFMWLLAGIVIGSGTILAYIMKLGEGVPKARTVAFCLMVMYQMVNVFNCRSNDKSLAQVGILSNPYLVGTVLISIALQFLVVYTPFMQILFHTVPLSLSDWLLVFGFSLTILIYDEIRKKIGA